jgi:hypothetical protein
MMDINYVINEKEILEKKLQEIIDSNLNLFYNKTKLYPSRIQVVLERVSPTVVISNVFIEINL